MKSFFKDVVVAILECEARIIVKKYHPTIIAITGSVGKTSTKDAIYSVLSGTCFVRKSEKSFNSEIGVPLTILGCQNGWHDPFLWIKNIFIGLELIMFKSKYPECLVLEVGADKPGDIARIAKWLRADVVVITKVSDVPVHVEFFPSAEALLKEKANLIKALKKAGTLVLSYDDEKVRKLGEMVQGKSGQSKTQKVVTFGVSSEATVSATDYSIVEENGFPIGIRFSISYQGKSSPVMVRGIIGTHHMYPLVAAAAVGISRGISLDNIAVKLAQHVPPRGRMNILKGINNSTIIDDTYNSSPDALNEALNTLNSIPTAAKKIAIIGDMMELGKFSTEEHKKAGEHALRVASVVIAIGQRASAISGITKSFPTSNDALDYVKEIVGNGDIVLVKGSQSIRMERIVKALLAEPEKAKDLLVRQEGEWLAKK